MKNFIELSHAQYKGRKVKVVPENITTFYFVEGAIQATVIFGAGVSFPVTETEQEVANLLDEYFANKTIKE